MRNDDQKIVEFENDPVSKLLGDLKRVEAPGDFDFRVKARIAAGRPADRTASWQPSTVRFAVPLSLLLVAGLYFGFNTLYPTDKMAVAPVADSQSSSIAPLLDLSTNEVHELAATEKEADRIAAKTPETNVKITAPPPEKKIVSSAPVSKQPGGGSYEEAFRPPRQIDPSRKIVAVPRDFDQNSYVPVKAILSSVGIDANYSGTVWKVGSVKQNSVADHSGLKAGDVIEAVNGQPLTEKTAFGSKFSGKSVHVRRDGKTIQIDLKP